MDFKSDKGNHLKEISYSGIWELYSKDVALGNQTFINLLWMVNLDVISLLQVVTLVPRRLPCPLVTAVTLL